MRCGAAIIGLACAALFAGTAFSKGVMIKSVARGTFENTMKPLAGTETSIGSMSIDKVFQGDLQGTSMGQMLAVRTPVAGEDGLKGLRGALTISQPGGVHHYEFDYELPASP